MHGLSLPSWIVPGAVEVVLLPCAKMDLALSGDGSDVVRGFYASRQGERPTADM